MGRKPSQLCPYSLLSFPPEYLSVSNLLYNKDQHLCLCYSLVYIQCLAHASCSKHLGLMSTVCMWSMVGTHWSACHNLSYFSSNTPPTIRAPLLVFTIMSILYQKHSSRHKFIPFPHLSYHQALSPISKIYLRFFPTSVSTVSIIHSLLNKSNMFLTSLSHSYLNLLKAVRWVFWPKNKIKCPT